MVVLAVISMLSMVASRSILEIDTPPSSEAFDSHLQRIPFIIRNFAQFEGAMQPEDWTYEKLRERFGEVEFRHGPGPYPLHLRPLLGEEENEIFQFGTLPATFSLGQATCLPPFGMRYGFATYLHDSGEVACRLLEGVSVPRFVRDLAPLIPLGGLLVGRTGMETAVHHHFAALNILLNGEKYWEMKGTDPFVQRAGDVVFIPNRCEHFVRNLRPCVAWTFQFHDNHFGTKVGIPETEAILLSLVPDP